MIEFSSSLKLNKIHTVDSPSNEESKNIFSREALISEKGRSEYLGEMGNNRDIYCYANRGDQLRKRLSAPTPWNQNPCDASIFLHARPNFKKKEEKNSIIRPKFDLLRVLSSQNIMTYSKSFYMTKRLWL